MRTEVAVAPLDGVLRRGLVDLPGKSLTQRRETGSVRGRRRRRRVRAWGRTARTRYQSTKGGRRGDRWRCGQDANAADAAHTSRAACAFPVAASAIDARSNGTQTCECDTALAASTRSIGRGENGGGGVVVDVAAGYTYIVGAGQAVGLGG
jgi:hypothetical protein